MSTRIPWLALGALSTGVLAPAQVPDGTWQPTPLSSQLPQTYVATNTVAGNFTGHYYPDFAILLGTQVALCTAPAIHNATDPILAGFEAYGLATLPHTITPGHNSLVVATPGGLVQWQIDTPLCSLDSGDWRSICVGDLDGVAPDDFVGISTAARDRIRIVLRNGASKTASEIVFASYPLAQVVVAQWNATPQREICVAGPGGLWIGSPSGMLRQFTQANSGPSLLTRVGTSGADHLAWWVTVNGQHQLRTFSTSGQIVADATNLGDLAHLAAGDINANGVGELVVTSQANGQPPRLLLESGPTAGPGATVQYDVANPQVWSPLADANPQPQSQYWGQPWLGDLNGDGFVDLFVPWRHSGAGGATLSGVWTFRQQPTGNAPRPTITDLVSITTDANQVATYSLPCNNFFTPGGAEPPTHLELLVWKTDASDGFFRTVPEGYRRVRIPFAEGSSTISFTVDWNVISTRAFVGAVRWIRVVGNATVWVWQPTRFAITANGATLPHEAWAAARLTECTTNTSVIWPAQQGNNYWMRAIPVEWTDILYSYRGDEEPPDLPPPPPVPPKPPTPPNDEGGG